MKIQVTLGERKRKELAQIIGELVGDAPAYKGAPSYAYEVGKFVVGRDAEITVKKQSRFTEAAMRKLLEGLRSKGIEAEANGFEENRVEEITDSKKTVSETPAEEEPNKLVIQMPLDDFDSVAFDNLRQIVASKALLIKKALEVTDLSIIKTELAICFPWFDRLPEPNEVKAYTNFIAALCEMAKRQKRVLATEKPSDNDKFVFRLFLVRLGLKGDQYADTRRVLLRNLTGNGSVKDPEAAKQTAESTTPATANPTSDDCIDEVSGVSKRKFDCLRRVAKEFMDYLMSDDDLWD